MCLFIIFFFLNRCFRIYNVVVSREDYNIHELVDLDYFIIDSAFFALFFHFFISFIHIWYFSIFHFSNFIEV
jgi:hypothetical protein